MEDKLIFVCTPYSNDDENIVKYRKKIAGEVCLRLVAKGIYAISPVVYGCALMEYGENTDGSWNYWQKFCETFLINSKAVYVIKIDGWDKSIGVSQEILFAITHKIPVYFINPETLVLEDYKPNV